MREWRIWGQHKRRLLRLQPSRPLAPRCGGRSQRPVVNRRPCDSAKGHEERTHRLAGRLRRSLPLSASCSASWTSSSSRSWLRRVAGARRQSFCDGASERRPDAGGVSSSPADVPTSRLANRPTSLPDVEITDATRDAAVVSVDTQVGGSMVAGQTNGMTSELTTDTRAASSPRNDDSGAVSELERERELSSSSSTQTASVSEPVSDTAHKARARQQAGARGLCVLPSRDDERRGGRYRSHVTPPRNHTHTPTAGHQPAHARPRWGLVVPLDAANRTFRERCREAFCGRLAVPSFAERRVVCMPV